MLADEYDISNKMLKLSRSTFKRSWPWTTRDTDNVILFEIITLESRSEKTIKIRGKLVSK